MFEVILTFWILSGVCGWGLSHKDEHMEMEVLFKLPFCILYGPILLARCLPVVEKNQDLEEQVAELENEAEHSRSQLFAQANIINKLQTEMAAAVEVIKYYAKDSIALHGEIDPVANVQAVDWKSVWDNGKKAREFLKSKENI